MRRRALRVMRPGREKNRRRRVLVVATGSPRPMRVVQRAKLWAITWRASQAPFGSLRISGNESRWDVVEAHAVFEIADGVVDIGVAAVVGFEGQGVALPVGDESMLAAIAKQRRL